MAIQPTGNIAFDAAVQIAERARQAAQAGSPTQAQLTAADIVWLSAVIAAGNATGGVVTTANEAAALKAILKTGNP